MITIAMLTGRSTDHLVTLGGTHDDPVNGATLG